MPGRFETPAEGEPLRDDEVHTILSLALRRQADHADAEDTLARAAAELGISPEALAQARAEVMVERRREQLRRSFLAERRAGFRGELISFASINLVLMAINFALDRNLSWSLFVLFFWGIGIFLKAVAAYAPDHPDAREAWREYQRKHGLPPDPPAG